MNRASNCRLLTVACLVFAFASCQQQPPETAPLLLEEPSVSFLRREIGDAIAEYEQADQSLSNSPEEAQESFARAHERLTHINSYYLPLMEARERTYNAYQLCANGDVDRSSSELDLVEQLLLGVAKTQNETARGEIETVLAALEGARLALDDGSARVTREIEALLRGINALLYKGRLVEE